MEPFLIVEKKSHMTYNEKRLNHHFRKTHMEQLNLITNFLGIKDKKYYHHYEYDMGMHKELHGYLDYESPKCPACKGQMGKYDFQKASKIPYLECAGYRTLIRLKKRRFKCKECGKNGCRGNFSGQEESPNRNRRLSENRSIAH